MCGDVLTLLPRGRTTPQTPAGVWRRVLTALTLVALLLPASATLLASTAPANAQSRAALGELDDQIEDAEAEVGRLDQELEISRAQLDQIIAELQATQAELDALNDELAGAQAQLEDRERILAATTAELDATAQRLDDTRAELEELRGAYEARVRQSYIAARPDQTLPVFSARNAADFTQAITYLEAIVSRDRAGFEEVDVLQTRIAADEAELARLRAQQESDREAAAAERDRVAGLVAQQEGLVAQVDAQAADKRTVLQGLESDRAAADQLIAELEAESDRIEQELAAAAEAAAAAAAAEAAAAAAATEAATGAEAPAAVQSGGGTASSSGTAGAVAGSGRFILPVSGRISSEYGYRVHPISGARRLHAGMDIAAGSGTPIGAAGDGTVIYAGWRGGYGNTVIVDHGGGIATLYAHQSRVGTSVGQSVRRGQVIGYVGSTGYSTGPHVHWEVRVNGSPQNPRGYL